MFGWIQKNVMLAIILGAMAAVIAAESSYIVHQSGKLGSKKAELETAQRDLGVAQTNLTQEKAANDLLEKANNSLIDEVLVSKAEQKASVEYIRNLEASLKTASVSTRKQRDEIYKEPGCDQLAKIDIAAMCPDLAGSLRQRAAATKARAATYSEGAGTAAARPEGN